MRQTMKNSAGRTLALILTAFLLLTACTSASPAPASRSDTPSRQAPPADAEAPPRTELPSDSGQALPQAEAPTASGAQPAPPQTNVSAGLDKGQRAPSFTVTGLDGRQISDADLQAAGEPYILYFHATW
jgi:hypothetical protein